MFYISSKINMAHTIIFCIFSSSIPVAVPGAYYGAGTGEILIDGLQCNGTEANIGYCGKHPLGVNNCSHTEDAGLMCLRKL